MHITGPFKPWIYSCATIWWEVFRVYLPTDYPVPRAMPTNVVGFVFAGNALAQRSRYHSALLFFVLAAQHVLVKYGQDSEIGSRIVALSRIGLYEAYSNDLRAAVEAYQAYFESLLGLSRNE